MKKIKIGISTCPNDTFLFHALLEKRIVSSKFDLQFELLDIQNLNEKLRRKELDVGKASFALAAQLRSDYSVLPVGSALGIGVGPIVVCRPGQGAPSAESRILCPGADTTAALLFKCFFPQCKDIVHTVFSEIMPAVERATADFGVLIHEGRFTFQNHNLALAADLGAMWETKFKLPLPLGGILVRSDFDASLVSDLGALFSSSLSYGHTHREDALLSMRKYAQEFSDQVLWQHIDLYVNKYTEDLGEVGLKALDCLYALAK